MTHVVTESRLPLPLLRRGKVREVYEVDAEHLLLVASDRVSAFDVVMREPIPRKGAVLTQISAFWFERLAGRLPVALRHRPDARRSSQRVPRAGRPTRTRSRAARCWCAGRRRCRSSASFGATSRARPGRSIGDRGTLAGEPLPAGLRESARLEPPLFSPATKAESGHDENVTFDPHGRRRSGRALPARLRDASFAVYRAGRDHAAARGIIIADTKFEFGTDGRRHAAADRRGDDAGQLALLAGGPLRAGRSQPSFDKQPLRDYLAGLKAAGALERRGAAARRCRPRWSTPPAARYLEAFRLLTGRAAGGVGVIRTAPEGRWFIVGAWVVALVLIAGRRAHGRRLGGS